METSLLTNQFPFSLIGDKMANASTRIAVNDECKMKYLELKAKRNYKFIIFKIEETIQQVVVEKLGEPNDKYEDLIASLPPEECRFVVFDLDFTTNENCQKSKIVFIAWSPDSSRARCKMLYASSKDTFIKELDDAQIELQATDLSEKDRLRCDIFELEDQVKQAISSVIKMCFPARKFPANGNRSFLDFDRKTGSIDFQYMLLGLYLAKFTSILPFDKSNEKIVNNSEKIIGSVVAENMNWLKKCAVGWMKEFLPVRVIIEEIKKEGIKTIEVKRMEGDMVLLYFENELEIQRLEDENWSSLLKIFQKVEKWSESLMVTKRSTWISCFGVPINSWNIDTFKEIANQVGEFIEIDKDTKSMQTFTRGNVHIYTNKKQRIEELMELQVGNYVYNIRVVEIENVGMANLSCCCGNFFQQSKETLSYSDEPMVKSSVQGELREYETGKAKVEDDDDVLNHDFLKRSVCDETYTRSPNEVGEVENTTISEIEKVEGDPRRVDSSVVEHLTEDQESRRKRGKWKFFDDLDEFVLTQKAEMEKIRQERKSRRSFKVRRDAEEEWKLGKPVGLSLDCDDNVTVKELVRIDNMRR